MRSSSVIRVVTRFNGMLNNVSSSCLAWMFHEATHPTLKRGHKGMKLSEYQSSGFLALLFIQCSGVLMSCSGSGDPYGLTNHGQKSPNMVLIPSGTYMMGNTVELSLSAFELARNELTWAEWGRCENDGGCSRLERHLSSRIKKSALLQHPVVGASLSHVSEYITWINAKTGRIYRLPSEAEWEYAARAGSSSHYDWGNDIGENRANCQGCNSTWDGRSTSPVGSFNKNAFGLYDMHGNVAEWVADCWRTGYDGLPSDGTARVNDCSAPKARVLKGGSWINIPRGLRAVHRIRNNVDISRVDIGFRLARSLP